MRHVRKTGSRASSPGRNSPPSRSPDTREGTRPTETAAPTLDPPEERFDLANSGVVVTITPIGAIARIEYEAGTEYGVSGDREDGFDALREVATAHE